jgi:hypothetical protein
MVIQHKHLVLRASHIPCNVSAKAFAKVPEHKNLATGR